MGVLRRRPEPAAVDGKAGRDLSHLTGDYTFDRAHTRIGFIARYAMIANVRGEFTEFKGKLHLDGADPSNSTAELVIKVASISTKQPQRDEHLCTGDFFDAEVYPEITFRSAFAEEVGGDAYRLHGDLTIKDVTRPIVLDFEFLGASTDPIGVSRVGFEGGITVDRTDWGLTYNVALETGGVLIGEKAKLVLDVSAVKAE